MVFLVPVVLLFLDLVFWFPHVGRCFRFPLGRFCGSRLGVFSGWNGVSGGRECFRHLERRFWFPQEKYREKVFLVPAGDNTVGCTTCNVVTRQNARWSIRDVAVQRTGQLGNKTEKQKTRAVEIDGIGGFAKLYAEIYKKYEDSVTEKCNNELT